MTQQWYPQRNERDGLTAALKTFLHYIQHPVSRQTIDEATGTYRQGAIWNSDSIRDLLNAWGVDATVHRDATPLGPIEQPELRMIVENDRKLPVVFFGLQDGHARYVHPRKGWVFEDPDVFLSRSMGERIEVSSVFGQGESDYADREQKYQQLINGQKGLQVAKWITDVLSAEECAYIIQLSDERFGRSKIGDQDTQNEGRTSYSAYLVIDDDPVLNGIRERIAQGIGIPSSHFEYFQCVSYENGQEYQAHYDTFDPETISGQEALADGGQRAWTLLIYLNDDYTGGQTYFPHLDLLATPERGCAVMFRNLDHQGRVLPESLHAGLPVAKGKKYALNLWVRQEATNTI